MDNSDMAFLTQMLINRQHERLKKIMADPETPEEGKVLAEMTILRSEIDHKSFLIGKKAFESKENAVLIRDYFRLVLAGFETFEKENFGEEK